MAAGAAAWPKDGSGCEATPLEFQAIGLRPWAAGRASVPRRRIPDSLRVD